MRVLFSTILAACLIFSTASTIAEGKPSLSAEIGAVIEAEGIGARVVSMPCWELFEEQDEAYRKDENIPEKFFGILAEQKKGLEELKAKFGSIVTPQQLEG